MEDRNQGVRYVVKVTRIKHFIAMNYEEEGTLDLVIDKDICTTVNLTPGKYFLDIPRGGQFIAPGQPITDDSRVV